MRNRVSLLEVLPGKGSWAAGLSAFGDRYWDMKHKNSAKKPYVVC